MRNIIFNLISIVCLSLFWAPAFAQQESDANKIPTLPDAKILFKEIWGEVWPTDVDVEPIYNPQAFSLKSHYQYLITVPVRVSADSFYAVKNVQGTLHWMQPIDAMLVAVVDLPGGKWPTNGAPTVEAYSPSAIPRNCDLQGLPGDGSENGPLPNEVNEIFLPNIDSPNQLPLHLFNVETTWIEGYAGGGGSFVVQQLLEWSSDVRYNHQIFWRACSPRGYDKLLAGDWNPNGTRDHHEYSGSWAWKFVHQTGPYPQWKLELFEGNRAKTPVARWSTDWQSKGAYTIDYYNVRTPTDF